MLNRIHDFNKITQFPTIIVSIIYLFAVMRYFGEIQIINLFIGFFVFFSSYFYIAKRAKNKKISNIILVISFIIVLIAIFTSKQLDLIWKLALVSIFGFTYNSKSIGFSARNYMILKNIWIAFCWSLSICFLSNTNLFIVFIAIFFHIMGLSIAFDIKDIGTDKQQTIANQISLKIVKTLVIGNLIISLLLFYLVMNINIFFIYLIGDLLLLLVILYIKPNSHYFYYFYVLEFANLFGWIGLFVFNN